MTPRTAVALLAALALSACSRGRAPAPEAGAPPAAASPAGTPADAAYLTAAVLLRRAPSEAARVPGPTPRSFLPNGLATLQRGEKVAILEVRDDWARVRASDETEGWLRSGVLLPAQGVAEATLLQPADAFDRPDLLAVNARRKLDPGSLVLVIRSRELFSEVNLSSGSNAWVLTDRLATDPRTVMVAKLVEKTRWLVRQGKRDEALTVLGLARKEFPDVPLVEVLAAELGEAADGGPPDGGLPPAPLGAPR